jgi:hypothetical protein
MQDLEFLEAHNFRRQIHIACNALRPYQDEQELRLRKFVTFPGATASRIEE